MTDINKQIGEEAREYAKSICYPLVLVDHEHRLQSVHRLVEKVYERGYNSALHSSRWRKASEELPDIGIWVNVKDSENDIDCIHITTEFELKVITNYYKFWKPID